VLYVVLVSPAECVLAVNLMGALTITKFKVPDNHDLQKANPFWLRYNPDCKQVEVTRP
jgi:hypothetical protein